VLEASALTDTVMALYAVDAEEAGTQYIT
jgi:hypothetical protein